MLVGFVTDIHVDERRLTGPTGHQALLDRTVEQIRDLGCDLVLVGGDLAGTQVPHRATPRERNALVRFFMDLAAFAPVVICRGNHDSLGDYAFLQHLAATFPIFYVEEAPELIDTGNAAVLVLPWLDRGRVAGEGQDYGDAVRAIYGAALDDVKDDLREAKAAGKPALLLLHAAIPDAVIRPGQPVVPTADPVIGLHDLLGESSGVEAVFVGHYHLHQPLQGPVPAWYGGSLFVNDYGENPDKGWLLYNTANSGAELQPVDQPWRLTIRVTDGTVEIVEPDGALDEIVGKTVAEAEVILRTTEVPAYIRIVAKVPEARLTEQMVAVSRMRAELAVHALGVKVELDVQRSARMREGASEVATAETIPSKIKHYTGRLSPKPEQPVVKRALQIFEELSAEVQT